MKVKVLAIQLAILVCMLFAHTTAVRTKNKGVVEEPRSSNMIVLQTIDCNATEGFIEGLPHYLELFDGDKLQENRGWIGLFLLDTSGTISYMFTDDHGVNATETNVSFQDSQNVSIPVYFDNLEALNYANIPHMGTTPTLADSRNADLIL